MFGKKDHRVAGKKKQEDKKIRVLGEGRILYEGQLEELPLREKVILEKSEELFHDPDPCYIHRGAVSIRLYLELEEAAKEKRWELWNRYVDLENIKGVELVVPA